MPLNIDDPENKSDPGNPGEGPVLHESQKASPKKLQTSTIIIVGIILLIMAGGGYVVWKFELYKVVKKPPAAAAQQPELQENRPPPLALPVDTSSDMHSAATPQSAVAQVDTMKKDSATSKPPELVKKKPPAESNDGTYTIFISRFRDHDAADKESAKWKEAGFETFVSKEDGWYRLSLGRYTSWDEAKVRAENLKDSFESGYRIGRIAD